MFKVLGKGNAEKERQMESCWSEVNVWSDEISVYCFFFNIKIIKMEIDTRSTVSSPIYI